MYVCRLYHRDDPHQELEARSLGEGRITLGRDPAADWPLHDPKGLLSRIHCTLAVEDGRLLLTDSSTNGTFFESGERAPRDEAVELGARRRIALGPLSILIDSDEPRSFAPPATLFLPMSQTAVPTPGDWADAGPAPEAESTGAHRDASLLEAFCEGARLDVSAFSGEDPVELMRRAGAVYQQTILGLATLMSERAKVKTEHSLQRTVIYAADNNPFKWSPTRRLAQGLLTGEAKGFLSDAAAVRASFEDISQHMAAVAQGAAAVTELVLETLAPEAIEAEARTSGTLLRGKAAVQWDAFVERYADLTDKGEGEAGPLAQAFAEAYAAAGEKKG